MKLKILIIEDYFNLSESINSLDNVWQDRIEIIQIANTAKEVNQSLESFAPNLIIAEMHPHKLDVINWLVKNSTSIENLCIVAQKDKAIQALKLGANDFLTPPIKLRDLQACLLKVYKKINPQLQDNVQTDALNKDTLLLWDNDRLKPIIIEQIVKIKSDGAYSEIYLKNDKKLCSTKNIGTYEDLLKEKKFMRIHHSCLVNLNYIEYYKPGMKAFVALSDSGIEYVSKSKKREFLNRFQRVKG